MTRILATRCAGILAAGLFWLAAAGTTAATGWTVDGDRSRITFTYAIDGTPREGTFTRFSGEGDFDVDQPEAATLDLRIESESIDLRNTLVSAYATSAEWFDSRSFPLVTYRLIGLRHQDGSRYSAMGEITLRGHTQVIETPLSLDMTDGAARADGMLQIDRRDFGLGVGLSDMFVEIGNEVSVNFELVAAPQP